MTLAEFLLARIAEDEALARDADVKQGDPTWWVSEVMASGGGLFTVRSRRDVRPIARVQRLDGDDDEPAAILDGRAVANHIANWDPARVLIECQAKRRLVDRYENGNFEHWSDDLEYERYVLPFLALPYADHPDYEEDWRP